MYIYIYCNINLLISRDDINYIKLLRNHQGVIVEADVGDELVTYEEGGGGRGIIGGHELKELEGEGESLKKKFKYTVIYIPSEQVILKRINFCE